MINHLISTILFLLLCVFGYVIVNLIFHRTIYLNKTERIFLGLGVGIAAFPIIFTILNHIQGIHPSRMLYLGIISVTIIIYLIHQAMISFLK